MTDFIEVTPGSGEQVAVDEIIGGPADGLKVQRMKLGFGPDGEYSDVDAGTPLPALIVADGDAVGGSAPLPSQLYLDADNPVDGGSPLPVQQLADGDPVGGSAPLPSRLFLAADTPVAGTDPLPAALYQGGAVVGGANPLNVAIAAPTELAVDGVEVTGAAPLPVGVQNAAGVIEASNPLHVSLATNPNLAVGGSDVSGGNPVPVSGTVGISGTVPVSGTVGVSGTVPISAASALTTAEGYLEATGGPIAAASTDIIASTDAHAYRSMVVQFTGTYSGSIVIQGSNNASNWFSLPIYDMSTLQMKPPVSSITGSFTSSLWLVNITTRYVRVRTNTYSSGSGISAIAELYGHPVPLPYQHGVPAYTENVGSGALSAAQNASFTADGDTFSGVSTALLATIATRIYNSVSSGWDRIRTASSAHGTTGTGLLGVGELRFDGTNYRRVRSGVSTSAHTSVAANASSVNLLASNSNREQATFYNDSATGYCYLKLGTTASATSFTYKMSPGAYYELPAPVWTGAVDGIWDVAVGSMRIGEFT